MRTLFIVCAAVIAYSYVAYPLLLHMVATKTRRSQSDTVNIVSNISYDSLPSVSIVIAAHNEEAVIGERVDNLLALDYPTDKLDIIIASDGSTDRTCTIVQSYVDNPSVRLLEFSENRGKAATLNEAVARASGDIVVLSDANTHFEQDAVTILVSKLWNDSAVVAVCGKLRLVDQEGSENADGIYWRYENWIKTNEGHMGALLGANGAIYAIRSCQYVPVPNNTIVDDFTIPLLIKLHHGGRIAYVRDAVATEETSPTIDDEFDRRTRIGVGAYQSLSLLWPLLSPAHGFTAFAFFSHKLLRWLTPFLMLAMTAFMLLGLDQPFFQWILAIAAIGTVGVTADTLLRKQGAFGLTRLVRMFLIMNLALLAGFFKWATLPQTGTWNRTRR